MTYDEAVRYLQETHGIKKADRSTIINAMLDNEANWTDESLDRYLAHSRNMDRSNLWLTSVMPRGWLVLALAVLIGRAHV